MSAADFAVRSTRLVGSVPRHRSERWTLVGQDGGQSIPFEGGTLFVFSDTLAASTVEAHPGGRLPRPFRSSLGPREMFLPNSAAVGRGEDLLLALEGLEYLTDGDGFVREALPALERERARGLRLWPLHGIAVDGLVHLYYLGIRTVDPSSIWGFRTVGNGLAVLDPATGRCDRVWRGDDWNLWPAEGDDFHMGVQVLREGDRAYVFASVRDGMLTTARLARVPVSGILDPDRYEFLASPGPEWVGDPASAADLGPCGSDYSVSWNQHLGCYLMFYVEPHTRFLASRTAPRPWGPWSPPRRVAGLPLEPRSEMAYLAFEHAAFSRDGGRTLFISYCQPRFTSNALLTVKLDRSG